MYIVMTYINRDSSIRLLWT